jgi:hypothetical protein
MRDLITIVEKLSRYSTTAPEHVGSRERSPIGQYLFHGTPIFQAINIIRTNEISTGIEWRGEGDRVALTRSYKVAVTFGEQGEFEQFPVVLVLDWKRLASNFALHPYDDPNEDGSPRHNDRSEDGTEQEEACYGTIRPLSKYLVSVNIDPAALQAAIESEDVAGYVLDEWGWNPKRFQAGLVKLSQSPLLNRITP